LGEGGALDVAGSFRGKLSQKWQQKVMKREFSLDNFDVLKFLVASRKMDIN
jgi:hypothetical protein